MLLMQALFTRDLSSSLCAVSSCWCEACSLQLSVRVDSEGCFQLWAFATIPFFGRPTIADCDTFFSQPGMLKADKPPTRSKPEPLRPARKTWVKVQKKAKAKPKDTTMKKMNRAQPKKKK